MLGFAAETTLIIHIAHRNEGGMPRRHSSCISSRLRGCDAIVGEDDDPPCCCWCCWPAPDDATAAAAAPPTPEVHPTFAGMYWSMSWPRRVSWEEQNRSRGLNPTSGSASSCWAEAMVALLILMLCCFGFGLGWELCGERTLAIYFTPKARWN